MIGDGAPAVGGPNDLDALLHPPPALPHRPGRVREYTLVARDEELEIAPGVFFPAWTYNGTVPGAVIRATEDDVLRVRFGERRAHPHTIHFHGIHPTNMDGVFEIVGPGEELHVRVPGPPRRVPRLPLSLDAAQEAHPQGPLRRLHHRPQGAARACPRARAGDERLRHGRRRREQLLHGQRADVLLRALSDPGAPGRARPRLPREPHRVRPDQLLPPPRGLLPVPADGDRRALGVHRHRDAVPGPARGARGAVRSRGDVHVPRPPVRVHRARLDGVLPGRGA